MVYTYEPEETCRDEERQYCHEVEKFVHEEVCMQDKSTKNDGYGPKDVVCSRKPTQDCYILSWRSSKNQLTTNPENTVFEAKRMIGHDWSDKAEQNDTKPYHQGTKTLGPEEISAMVLTKVKGCAKVFLGKKATYEDIKKAGVNANLTALRIINEPAAAVIAYGKDKKEDKKEVPVFDIGEGTFHVSFLTIDRGVFDIIPTNEDTHLEGEDFDQCVVEHFTKPFKKERAKRALSAAHQARVEAKFEKLNTDLFKETLKPVPKVLEDTDLTKKETDELIPVRGSTRIPTVQSHCRGYPRGRTQEQRGEMGDNMRCVYTKETMPYGEFSRCYIPRLQVVEEEPTGVDDTRELTTRILREQDRDWERNRTRELGSEAIMGPTTSPKKRAKDMEEGAETGLKGSKRKRRKLKHEVLQEGWGEHPMDQGADQEVPGARREEQRPHPTPREQGSPPVLVEQGNVEQGTPPALVRGSRVPREQSLIQLEITPYCCSTPPDKTTSRADKQLLEVSQPRDPPATRNSSGGSPSMDEQVGGSKGNEDDDQFGTSRNDQEGNKIDRNVVGGDLMFKYDVISRLGDDHDDQDEGLKVCQTTPSVGDSCTTVGGRKLRDRDQVAELSLQAGTDKNTQKADNQCDFKRGGKCIIHGVIGEKRVNTSKIWDKKKNGLFEWIVKTKTTYVCRFNGVDVSNVCSDDESGRGRGVAESNYVSGSEGQYGTRDSTTALGGTDNQVDRDIETRTRISGTGINDAGCNKSEMKWISSTEKDLR